MKKTIPSVTIDSFVEEFLVPASFDADGVQATAAIGKDGKEYGDPVPMSPHVPRDLEIADHGMRAVVERIMRDQMIAEALHDHGVDTPEEADDFYVEDDPLDPLTPYERYFEPPPVAQTEKKAPPVGGASEVIVPRSQAAGAADSGDSVSAPAPAPQAGSQSQSSDSVDTRQSRQSR